MNKKIILIGLIFIFLIACVPQQITEDGGQQTAESTATINRPPSTATNTPQPTLTPVPVTETAIAPQPSVTILAVTGNLYIRRGPSTKYSRIGVLTKGTSAEVIGQDVLSKWVQINIPNSNATGWVSIQTNYHRVDGDLKQIPAFTFTDFPQPAYIKNCTEHELMVAPGDYYLFNLFTNAKYLNEVKVEPGTYTIYDMFVAGEPAIQTVDLQEGETAYITVNGLGVSHKCP
jgi:uncharacterized protein YgiM (DUF1202 family)